MAASIVSSAPLDHGSRVVCMLQPLISDLGAACEQGNEKTVHEILDVIRPLLLDPKSHNIDGQDSSVLAEVWDSPSPMLNTGMSRVVEYLVSIGDPHGHLSTATPNGDSVLTRTVEYGCTSLFFYMRENCWEAVTVPGYRSLDSYLGVTSPEIAAFIRSTLAA